MLFKTNMKKKKKKRGLKVQNERAQGKIVLTPFHIRFTVICIFGTQRVQNVFMLSLEATTLEFHRKCSKYPYWFGGVQMYYIQPECGGI